MGKLWPRLRASVASVRVDVVAPLLVAGKLKPGGTVVEGTAGNTGIGLAHVCNARGYKCVIYMPDTQSQEKISLLRVLGADVRPVPAVPFTDPMNYNHLAMEYADSHENGERAVARQAASYAHWCGRPPP